MAKLQPSVMTLNFNLSTGDGTGEIAADTIDLSQCVSAMNRRFYRQGLNWAVAGFTAYTAGTGAISIAKIPNTWVASNAWHKAFAMWKKQQDEALEEAGAESGVAKFRDFKIFMDEFHAESGKDNNLVPFNYEVLANSGPAPPLTNTQNNPITFGEWDMSRVVVPNVTPDASGSEVDPIEYELHMVGDNYNTVIGASGYLSRGIIEGYADSRAYPQSPDPVGPNLAGNDNWMARMQNVGNEDPNIINLAEDQNDDLPYDQVNYPNGETNGNGLELLSSTLVTSTTVGGKSVIQGSNFPCGLIRVVNQPSTGTSWAASPALQVHLVAGSHRGYLASAMQDM